MFEDKPWLDHALKFSLQLLKQFMHLQRAIISTISRELRNATFVHGSIEYLG